MFPPEQPTASFPYRIEEEIGKGAMGVVYRAEETSLERPVAIKVLRRDYLSSLDDRQSTEVSHRFLQEARAAAQLGHPGIATVYRVGIEAGVAYIAMEWLDGRTLEELIDAEAPLAIGESSRLMVSLLETLSVAHEHGVVHRDIKPGNLIVLGDGRIKIMDFGIAHVQNSNLVETQAGSMMGTPLYAAPEQLNGQGVDGRADLYSTAVVLFEMITAHVPFDATNVMKLMSLILSQPPETPRQYNPMIPEGLEAVILRAMSKSATDRFASATEMAEALRPYAASVSGGASLSGGGSPGSVAPSESSPGAAQIAVDETLAAPPALPGDSTSSTAGEAPCEAPETPTMTVQGRGRRELVVHLVRSFPSRDLGVQSTSDLLGRLLETPLHAPAFAGAAQLGSALVFLYDGLIYAMIDLESGAVGDVVHESMPEQAPSVLYPMPDTLDDELVVLLASIIHPPKVRHADLDSSFVDLVQLSDKLAAESFSGALRLQDGPRAALLFFDGGENVLNLFSEGWERDPEQCSWQTWIRGVEARAHVEDKRIALPFFSYRQEARNLAFEVDPPSGEDLTSTGGRRTSLSGSAGAMSDSRATIAPAGGVSSTGMRHGTMTMQGIVNSDPMISFLQWMVTEVPPFFAERDRVKHWKYLVEWIELVERAKLHHDLPRPDSVETDFFDLVTFDGQEKVLHVCHRVARGDAASLEAFIERVLAAKEARVKTGDIGGACLIAPSFDEEALSAYDLAIAEPEKKSWLFGLQGSLTKYEGFVRIGAKRGFHLLLVAEQEDGSYRPLLPG